MSQPSPFRLKCESVPYRKGFVEVTPSIHDGCVNIETWEVHAEASLEDAEWMDDPSIPDPSVIANCEFELTALEARNLAEALLTASQSVEDANS